MAAEVMVLSIQKKELDRNNEYCKEWAEKTGRGGPFCCRECVSAPAAEVILAGNTTTRKNFPEYLPDQHPMYALQCTLPQYVLLSACPNATTKAGVALATAPFPEISERYSGFECGVYGRDAVADGANGVGLPSSCAFLDDLPANAPTGASMTEQDVASLFLNELTSGTLRYLFYRQFLDLRAIVAEVVPPLLNDGIVDTRPVRVFRNSGCIVSHEPRIHGQVFFQNIRDVRLIRPNFFSATTIAPDGFLPINGSAQVADVFVYGGVMTAPVSVIAGGSVRIADFVIGSRLSVSSTPNAVLTGLQVTSGDAGRGTVALGGGAAVAIEVGGTEQRGGGMIHDSRVRKKK